jgi:hypothetical protein
MNDGVLVFLYFRYITMPKNKCIFNSNWLSLPKYSQWLEPGKTIYVAKCRVCCQEFDISNMGKSALESHSTGKKHLSRLPNSSQPILQFHSTPMPESSIIASYSDKVQIPVSSRPSFTSACQFLDIQSEAEVLWLLKLVSSHYSYR